MQKDTLSEYLQGALAGRMIESPARFGDCPVLHNDTPRGDMSVQVETPKSVAAGGEVELSVKVSNFLQRKVRGEVILHGEDAVRDASYDFHAAFMLREAQSGIAVAFNWRAPSYATQVRWSAVIHFDQCPGIGMPRCSDTVVVVPAN
jgi:hypothetical protein